MKNKNTRRGFTLIELLVVVLIIGVLTSVAVPQYQKAVLKSRFSTVMPVAKAIADGNEVFYQGRGYYANNVDELDIQALSADTNATVELASIEKSESGFDYVLARRSDVPGLAYIIYQSHSEQFPGTIMCEANDTLNPKASELCEKVLQGRAVSNGSLQGDNWKAYLLAGEQGSSKFTSCMGAKPAPIVAGQSRATGTATCNEKTGEYEYSTWENGRTYSAYSECKANGVSYACAGATFTGNFSKCEGDAANACAGSTFQQQAYCLGKLLMRVPILPIQGDSHIVLDKAKMHVTELTLWGIILIVTGMLEMHAGELLLKLPLFVNLTTLTVVMGQFIRKMRMEEKDVAEQYLQITRVQQVLLNAMILVTQRGMGHIGNN